MSPSRALPLTLLLAAVACSHSAPAPATPAPIVTEPAPAPAPEPVVRTRTDTVQVKDPDQQRKLDRLELQLADAESRIAELEQRLDAAHQEVVNSMARTQGTASRAAAASGIAETELATQSPRGTSAADVAQAKRLLGQANEAFKDGNYAGALYLTDQAKGLVAPARRVAGSELPARPGEKSFSSPVAFKAARRGNVREGPGPGFKVLYTVSAGSALTGVGYTDQWVKVTDDGGRAGWIAKELLTRKR